MGGFILWLKRRKIIFLVIILSFILSGLIVNCMQALTIPLYYINRRLFRVLNAKIVYLHWCIIPWAVQNWANYKIRLFAEPGVVEKIVSTKEHALCTLNHRGDLDWMIGWCMIERAGKLGGTKAIMKDVAKYLPGIGWTFVFMEYPLLKRDWKEDEQRLAAACDNLAGYPVEMLLCLFAEGTRFTKEKHKVSMEFARSRGLPLLKHHLVPRTKGFCFLMQQMKGTIDAIYDITICYHDEVATILGVVNAEPLDADILIRRFPVKDIAAETDKELSDWLMKLYQEKDELVDYHNKHKRFPMEESHLPKRPWPELIVYTWLSLLGVPALLAAFYLLWTGSWFILGIIVLVFILAEQLFYFIARETETRKTASSYGLKNGPPPKKD